jgi:hypothetical protein
MECRVCKQPISFIKGARPGQSRKSTIALHDSELSQVLAEMQGEVVVPHPGTQRKLRMDLEYKHNLGQQSARETQDLAASTGPAEPSSDAEPPAQSAIPESEIPGAAVVNQPAGEQPSEHIDAQRSASG